MSSGDIRAQKLGEVFNKVTEASVNSISEVDLSASFNVDCGNGRTLKDVYGSNLQKLFFNFISKTQSNIISTFQDISIRHSVDDLIAHIDAIHLEEETSRLQKQAHMAQVVSQQVTSFDAEASRKQLLADMKQMEKNMILAEMAALDMEVRRLQEASHSLQDQVASTLADVREEYTSRYKLDSA